MCAKLNKNMFTMEEAFEVGKGLQEANGGNGRIRVRPMGAYIVVTLV